MSVPVVASVVWSQPSDEASIEDPVEFLAALAIVGLVGALLLAGVGALSVAVRAGDARRRHRGLWCSQPVHHRSGDRPPPTGGYLVKSFGRAPQQPRPHPAGARRPVGVTELPDSRLRFFLGPLSSAVPEEPLAEDQPNADDRERERLHRHAGGHANRGSEPERLREEHDQVIAGRIELPQIISKRDLVKPRPEGFEVHQRQHPTATTSATMRPVLHSISRPMGAGERSNTTPTATRTTTTAAATSCMRKNH